MVKVLVTGGAGFIGSHCVDSLLKRGDTVFAIDNFNDFYSKERKEANVRAHLEHECYGLAYGDCADRDFVRQCLDSFKPNKVLHLAARAGVQPSWKDPAEYMRSNVLATTILLDECEKQGIDKFVFASSSSVYGGNTKVPFSEEDRVDNQVSPYATTKRSCELIANTYAQKGMRIAGLRFFTVYGPRNRPDMAIYQFARNISEGKPIKVFGQGDEVRRDWTYVSVIVDGIMASLDNVHKFKCEMFNLGNCRPTPVMELVKLLEDNLGKKAVVERAPLPVGDVLQTYADTSKAKRLLGWEQKTPLEAGVKEFVNWFKTNG